MIVLIIEDQTEIASLWKQLLAPIGCEFRTAENLQEGLLQMRKLPPPDLVLLDLMLPGSYPEQTLAKIRTLKEINPNAVVMVVTGCSDAGLPALASTSGADAFHQKQTIVGQSRLLMAVKIALRSKDPTLPVFEKSLRILESLGNLSRTA